MSEHDQAKTHVPEMTGRVVIVSIIIAAMLGVLNVYSGALTGVYWGGSVVAAVLGYAILSIGGNKPTILEANMVQTIASAGGVAPLGLLNAYVAAMLLGMPFDFIEATLVLTLGSLMGVIYVVVFRRALIVEEELAFPAGVACAETLKVCDASGDEASKRARLLAITAVIAAVVVLLRDQFKVIPFYLDFTQYLPEGFVFNIAIYPLMISMGYIIGIRPALMFFIGGAIMWWIMGPVGFHMGVFPNPQIDPGPLSTWVTSPAVGLILGGSLMPMILNYKTFLRALKTLADVKKVQEENDVPLKYVLWSGGVIAAISCAYFFSAFQIPVMLTIASIVVIFFAVFILTRCVGETGLNPGTLIGWVTLGIIAMLGLKDPVKLLILGTFMMTASGLATDIMQDLKTGYLVGASPKAQIAGEFIGILPGVLAGIFATVIIIGAHGMGSPQAPYPMGFAWKGVAESLAGGGNIINFVPLLIATIIGAASTFFGLPTLTAGIAMFLPIGTGVAMLIGGLARLYVKKKSGSEGEEKHLSTASGLMVGEGFAAMIISLIIFIRSMGA